MGVVEKWNSINLIWKILGGMIVGAVLGILLPEGVEVIDLLGTLFVAALKAVAPVLVFLLVMSALANAKTAGSMKTVVVLYIFATFSAAFVAVSMSFAFPVEMTLAETPSDVESAPEGIGEVLTTLLANVFANPVDALMNANYLGILFWAVILGVALRSASPTTKTVLENLAQAITKVVRWIIGCAPFGILGLVYTAVSTSGLEIFTTYGQLLALLVGCMLLVAFVVDPLISGVCMRCNPYPLVLRCLKDSAITAFFTRSSAANIPVNMKLCQDLGLDRDNYSVSIPLGATINMSGAAVTISVMTMATVHMMDIAVDFPTALVLSVLSAVAACGASGVAGGSLLLIPMACSLFGIGNDVAMQVVAVGLVIGVVQDSCETALNSSSDVLFTASAEYRARRKAGVEFHPGANAPEPAGETLAPAPAAGEPMPDAIETPEAAGQAAGGSEEDGGAEKEAETGPEASA